MIRTSEAINEISEALAKAQAKFGAAIKDSKNPHFGSKYADLTSVIDATLEHLNSEGITAMQHPALEFKGEGESREAVVTVTTRLQHKSGQWMESDLSVPAKQRNNFDAQSVGSGITYACRYALQSICCVPRADDDGESAVAREVEHQKANKGFPSASSGQERPPDETAALFYVWSDASQTALITGHRGLMKINEDILRPLKVGKELVATADQLEYLKLRLEERNTPFRPLKAL